MYCYECGKKLITALNGDVCLDCLDFEEKESFEKEESAKYDLKHALANSLQALKGFEVGYTSKTNERIVVEHNGNVFVLNFEISDYTLEGAVDDLWVTLGSLQIHTLVTRIS